MLPVLGAVHVLLLTTAFTAPRGAVSSARQVFDGGVTPAAAETRAADRQRRATRWSAWFGAGFLIAGHAGRARRVPRTLAVVSAVFAVGLMLPPVGWAVTYLMAFWFAGVGIWLWRRALSSAHRSR